MTMTRRAKLNSPIRDCTILRIRFETCDRNSWRSIELSFPRHLSTVMPVARCELLQCISDQI